MDLAFHGLMLLIKGTLLYLGVWLLERVRRPIWEDWDTGLLFKILVLILSVLVVGLGSYYLSFIDRGVHFNVPAGYRF